MTQAGPTFATRYPPGDAAQALGVTSPGSAWLYAFLFCLALNGYPLAAAVTTILEIEGPTISYIFRALVILMCMTVFAHAATLRALRPFPVVIGLFLFLYLVRLLVDTFVRGLFDADYALLFFLGITLVPTITLACAATLFDERKVASAMVMVAGAGVVSIMLLNTFQISAGTTEFEETRRLSFSALNAITVGYTGLFTIIGAAALWPRVNSSTRLLLVPLMVLGAITMVQAASRGPIVAAFACIAAVAMAKRKWYVFAIFLAAAVYGADYAAGANFEIIERFQDLAGDRSANERLLLQTLSIELALASPILGHAYVETYTFFYPHNLLIESGLALGLVGFGMMLFFQIQFLLFVRQLLREGHLLLPMLLLTALVNANLSASIWGAADFWILGSVTYFLMRRSAKARVRSVPAAPLNRGYFQPDPVTTSKAR